MFEFFNRYTITGYLYWGFNLSFSLKNLVVIGVTGTKGKTTTTELVNAIWSRLDIKQLCKVLCDSK